MLQEAGQPHSASSESWREEKGRAGRAQSTRGRWKEAPALGEQELNQTG